MDPVGTFDPFGRHRPSRLSPNRGSCGDWTLSCVRPRQPAPTRSARTRCTTCAMNTAASVCMFEGTWRSRFGIVTDGDVTETQAKRLGDTALHRDHALPMVIVVEPAPFDDLIVLIQRSTPGQVELAVDESFGALVEIVIGHHRLAVNRDETAAHHRV